MADKPTGTHRIDERGRDERALDGNSLIAAERRKARGHGLQWMSPAGEQLLRIDTPQSGPLVVRWLLRPDRQYQQAKAEFSPFARLQAEDPDSRRQIVAACRAALAAERDVYVIANNKAEGSSPLSLQELAQEIIAD